MSYRTLVNIYRAGFSSPSPTASPFSTSWPPLDTKTENSSRGRGPICYPRYRYVILPLSVHLISAPSTIVPNITTIAYPIQITPVRTKLPGGEGLTRERERERFGRFPIPAPRVEVICHAVVGCCTLREPDTGPSPASQPATLSLPVITEFSEDLAAKRGEPRRAAAPDFFTVW